MRLFEIKTIRPISELDAFYLTEEAVNSSWIADLSYDEDTGSVIMTTLSGSEYEIPDVPYEEFEAWVSAPSKGKHWWESVRGIYT
jgi:hypothetical protein